MNFKTGLSIVIPTFNREKQLYNQLKSIFDYDTSNLDEIIILDNNSAYDVSNLVKQFKTNKIRIVSNPFNIRVHSNIANAFYYCKTEWFWLLSDDDETLYNSLNQICEEIACCPENTGMIQFARLGSIQKDAIVLNLKEYIDYYFHEKNIRRGDLVFISTNVYNIENIQEYLGFAFEYSYSYIPHLIPIFKALDDEKCLVKFSSKQIVKFIPPREGWYSFGVVGKGLSTLSHIPLNLNKNYWKKFLDCTMSITPGTLINRLLNDDKVKDLQDAIIIYNNIYRYYLPLKSKIILHLFFFAMSQKNLKTITIKLLRLFKKAPRL